MQRIRSYMRFMNENLDAYDWPEVVNSLSGERKLAEELIEKRKRTYRIPCMEMDNLIKNTVYVNPDDRTGKRLSLSGFLNV